MKPVLYLLTWKYYIHWHKNHSFDLVYKPCPRPSARAEHLTAAAAGHPSWWPPLRTLTFQNSYLTYKLDGSSKHNAHVWSFGLKNSNSTTALDRCKQMPWQNQITYFTSHERIVFIATIGSSLRLIPPLKTRIRIKPINTSERYVK